MAAPLCFEVLLTDGIVEVEGADAYAPDGALTTFYRCRDGRDTIDSWATRVASFRTADVLRILRIDESDAPRLSAIA